MSEAAHTQPTADVISGLDTESDGLSASEARTRRGRHGNHEPPEHEEAEDTGSAAERPLCIDVEHRRVDPPGILAIVTDFNCHRHALPAARS